MPPRRSLMIRNVLCAGKASLTALGRQAAMHRNQIVILIGGIFWFVACLSTSAQQEFLPSPPADHSLIYTLDQQNKLIALPFETAATPLKPDQVAKSTATSYLDLKGEHSATVLEP